MLQSIEEEIKDIEEEDEKIDTKIKEVKKDNKKTKKAIQEYREKGNDEFIKEDLEIKRQQRTAQLAAAKLEEDPEKAEKLLEKFKQMTKDISKL